MAINQINTGAIVIKNVPISQLIRTFNLSNLKPLTVRDNPFDGKIDQTDQRDEVIYNSSLGTPVVTNLIFDSVTYTDFNTNKKISTQLMQFDTVLCTVSRPTIIVKTQINQRAGTVKEYITKDDFVVTINGIITGGNGQRPTEEINELTAILESPVAIPVSSKFLNDFGIYNIVVTDYSMPQTAGGWSKQEFTINAISDLPLELQIV
jgi:hypothetical protein